MKDPWHELAFYESSEHVKDYHFRKHKYSLSNHRAAKITAHFVQAREYFKASNDAPISVAPLLQYYGVMSLTQGTTLLLRGDDWKTIQASHGFSGRATWNLRAGEELTGIGNLQISLNEEGTAPDLVKFTDNRNYLASGWMNEIIPSNSFTRPPIGHKFTFEQIAASVPDLFEEYFVWKGDYLLACEIQSLSLNSEGKRVNLVFDTKVENVDALELLKPWGNPVCEAMPQHYGRNPASPMFQGPTYSIESDAPFPMSHFTYDTEAGKAVVLQKPLCHPFHLNTLSTYYCASYIFGMLVRYFPPIWTSMGTNLKGNKIEPLIKRFLFLIQTRFPRDVMNTLRIESFSGEGYPEPETTVTEKKILQS